MKKYTSPSHFKAALEQRIRNQIGVTGGRIERLRQFIVYDRFVARLRTVLGDGFILKGGFVLELRLASARTTRDVDLTLFGDPRALLRRLQEAGRLDLDDFFTFDVSEHPRGSTLGAPELPYQGERYRCACQLAGKVYGDPFGTISPSPRRVRRRSR